MPNFSTSRAVRQDYFGRGANNNLFFFIPVNVPGGTGPNQGRFGTLGRDTFRGPGFNNYDIAMIKDTPFGRRGNAELGTIEFRAEFFNIFNHTNFTSVGTTYGSGSFGQLTAAADPRIAEMVLRYEF